MLGKPLYVHTNFSGVWNEETKVIQALRWCPSLVVFLLEFFLLIFYKQLQLILRIWDILHYDFYKLLKISGMDLN